MFNVEDIRKALRLLDVPKAQSIEEVRTAWRRAAIKFHPDKNKAEDASEQFKRRSTAWEEIKKFVEMGGKLPLPKPVKRKKMPKPGRTEPGSAVPPRSRQPQTGTSRTVWVNPVFAEEWQQVNEQAGDSCPAPAAPFVFRGGLDPLLDALMHGVGLGGLTPDQIMQQVATSLFNPPPVCGPGWSFGQPQAHAANVVNPGWSFGNAPRPAPQHPWATGAATPRQPPPPPPGYTRVRTGTPRTHRRRNTRPAPEVVAQSVRQAATSTAGPRPHRAPPYKSAEVQPTRKGRVYFEVTAEEMRRFGKETGGGKRPGKMNGRLVVPGRGIASGCYDVQILNGVPVVDGMPCTFRPVKH